MNSACMKRCITLIFFSFLIVGGCEKDQIQFDADNYCTIKFTTPTSATISFKWEEVTLETVEVETAEGILKQVLIEAVALEQDKAKKILSILIPFEAFTGAGTYTLGKRYLNPVITYTRYIKAVKREEWYGISYSSDFATTPQEDAFFTINSGDDGKLFVVIENIEIYPKSDKDNSREKVIINSKFGF
jgi:hypothetical protein